jgi:hypothetical protein
MAEISSLAIWQGWLRLARWFFALRARASTRLGLQGSWVRCAFKAADSYFSKRIFHITH